MHKKEIRSVSYYYTSVRDKKGKIKSIYLGRNYFTALRKDLELKGKTFYFNFGFVLLLLIILTTSIFLIQGIFSQKFTGKLVLGINGTASADAYIEVDGYAQPMPLQVVKVGEDRVYNLTNLVLELPAGGHHIKIIDNGNIIYDANVIFAPLREAVAENKTAVHEEKIPEQENLTEEVPLAEEPSLVQYPAEIGKPVKWKRKVSLDAEGNLKLEVPDYADNFSVKKIDGANAEVLDKKAFDIKEQGKGFGIASSGNKKEITTKDKGKDFEVEYETPAPVASENKVNNYSKEVVVSSEIHYTNILSYTRLPVEVSKKDNIKLLWKIFSYQNITDLNLSDAEINEINSRGYLTKNIDFEAFDSDLDGLYDSVQWIVPSLSNQTYEISINILNVHSEPSLFGNWIVYFDTTGIANLTITATKDETYSPYYTRWSNSSENDEGYDLRFIEIKCGQNIINYFWSGENCHENECSVFIPDYQCNETSQETSETLTPKEHVLRFDFGGESEYAYNRITSVTLNAPPNNTYSPTATPQFNFTAISNYSLTFNCTLSINTTSAFYGYGTNYSTSNNTLTSIVANASLPEGIAKWRVNCSDLTAGTVLSQTRSITVDTTPPLINFTFPTPDNNTVATNSTTAINVTVGEVNPLKEFKFNWNGTNTTYYNYSLIFMMNLNNLSAIGDNDSRAVDVSNYSNNGTCYSTSDVLCNWSAGVYGTGMYFDNANSNYISITDKTILKPARLSVEAWVYPINPIAYSGIIYKSDGNYITDYGLIQVIVPNEIRFFVNNYASSYATANIPANQWSHVVGTYDRSTIKIYVNSKLINYTSYTSAITYGTNPLLIGEASAGYYWNGYLDEVNIYNYALSAQEVSDHYYANFFKFNSTYWLFSKNQTIAEPYIQANYTYFASAKDVVGNENSTETRQVTAFASINLNFTYPTLDNNSITSFRNVPINLSLTEANLWNFTLNWNNTNYSYYDKTLLLMLNLDNITAVGDTNSTPQDISVYNSNYTYLNNYIACYSGTDKICNYTDGKYGKGLYFDGVDDYVTVPYSSFLNVSRSNVSVELWAYPISMVAYSGLLYKSDGTYLSDYGLIHVSPANEIRFFVNAYDTYYAQGTLNFFEWNHIVGTYDRKNIKLYINGKLVNSTSFADTINITNSPLVIGEASAGYYFNGILDEVYVYNRSLSADEVSLHYYSHLYKYNSSSWGFYSNRTLTEPLLSSNYSYSAYAYDTSGNLNQTETRSIKVLAENPLLDFKSPTTANNTGYCNSSIELNVSISELNLKNILFNWNGTGYDIYNSNLILMLNLDNITTVGDTQTTVKDMSAYGSNLKCYPSAVWGNCDVKPGKYGKSLNISSAANDYALISPKNATLFNITNFTLSFWWDCDSLVGYGGPFKNYISGQNGFMLSSNVPNTDEYSPRIEIFNASGETDFILADATQNLSVPFNGFKHFIVTYNGSTPRLWISGVEKSLTSAADAYDGGEGIMIGSAYALAGGRYDNLFLYNRSFSDSEAKMMYYSNLYKYDADKWQYYLNQSNLTNSSYTYYFSANDTSGNANSSDTRILYVGSAAPSPSPSPSLVYINITNCTSITTNGSYIVNASLDSAGTCINITANNVTLDCAGYIINYSSSTAGYGVDIIANNTVVKNCFINQTGNTNYAYGIYLRQNTNNNTILNNSITNNPSGYYSDLIYSHYSYNNNIINNSLQTQSSTYSYGVNLQYSDNSNFTGNSINTTYYSPIYLIYSNNNSFSYNALNVTNSWAVQFSSSNNNKESYDTISSGYGSYIIYISGVNNTINNSLISSDSSSSQGIYISGSQTYIINNTFNMSGSSSYGLNIGSNNNEIRNNKINMFGASTYCIYLSSANYNNITNNTFYSNNSAIGIRLYSSNGNEVLQNRINGTKYAFDIAAINVNSLANNIDSNNLVNGFPFYYYHSLTSGTIDCGTLNQNSLNNTNVTYNDIGKITIANSTGVILKNCNISNGNPYGNGISLLYSNDITVMNSNITNNNYGIYLYNSNRNNITNVIVDNSWAGTSYGIYSYGPGADNNTITFSNISGYSYSPLYVYYSHNNSFSNNIINVTSANAVQFLSSNYNKESYDNVYSSYGSYIYYISGMNNTINNSFISSDSSSSQGIYTSGPQTYIQNNTFNLSGSSAYGLNIGSSNNEIRDNWLNMLGSSSYGIYLSSANYNNIFNNTIFSTSTVTGIRMYSSNGNELSQNRINGTRYAFDISAIGVNSLVNNIYSTNLVNGLPFYYYHSLTSGTIDCGTLNQISLNNSGVTYNDIGKITIANSTGVILKNCNISNGNPYGNGISLLYSNDITIMNSNITNNYNGIYLYGSNRNNITNVIVDNSQSGANYGVYFYGSGTDNNTLTFSNISGYYYSPLYVYYSHNNSFSHNIINVTNANAVQFVSSNYNKESYDNVYSSYGSYIYYIPGMNNTINNSFIFGLSSSAQGVYISGTQNYVSNNSLNFSGASSYGINLGSGNNEVRDNQINMFGSGSYGLYFSAVNYNLATGNNININGSSSYGLYLYYSNYNVFNNNNFYVNGSNSKGLNVPYISTNNNFTNDLWYTNARYYKNPSNDWAIYTYNGDSNNILTNNIIQGDDSSSDVNISIGYAGQIGIRGVGIDSRPGDPTGYSNFSKYLNITNTTVASLLMNISYSAADASIINESTMVFQRNNGTDWSNVDNFVLNTDARDISANISTFSIFAPFGKLMPASVYLNFTYPTPDNGASGINFEINTSLFLTNPLQEFNFDIGETNYNIYNSSLLVMYNFNNMSVLGDSETNIADLSNYGNDGTYVGGQSGDSTVDLAANKTATQSSQYGGVESYGPGKAVDQNFDSFQHTNGNANEWWSVDLGASYDLVRFEMYKRAGYCSRPGNYQIQLSPTGAFSGEETTVVTQTDNGQCNQNFTITSASGRYVRVYDTSSEYMNIAEFRAYAAGSSGYYTYIGGKYGTALDLNGMSTYLNMKNATDLPTGTNARTICAWASARNTTGYKTIAAFGINLSGQSMSIGMDEDSLYGGAYSNYLSSASFWSADTWNHVCLTYNGSKGILYGNGASLASQDMDWDIANSVAYVGREVNDSQYWNGSVDEVRIWNRSLSPDEIKQIYYSNLFRYNLTSWYFYANESKMPAATYNYLATALDNYPTYNSTETRSFTLGAPAPALEVTLLNPANNSASIIRNNRQFNWSANNETPVTFDFELSDAPDFSNMLENVNTTNTTYNIAETLDVDTTYYWRVRVNDSTTISDWNNSQFIVDSLVAISLPVNSVNFGNVYKGYGANTTNGTIPPLQVQNDGNCFANITFVANNSLFTMVGLNESNFQFMVSNASELYSYNTTLSINDYTNINSSEILAIGLMNYTTLNNIAYVNLLIAVPSNEPGGTKQANMTFSASIGSRVLR